MNVFKSHLLFNRQQRGGILSLILLIFFGLLSFYFISYDQEELLDVSSPEIRMALAQIDSLRLAQDEKNKPKIYPFNPNFISDDKAYTLGMSTKEFDRLIAFRKSDKWINSVAEFKSVTGVSDSLLKIISPQFKFPEWVSNPTPNRKRKGYNIVRSFEEKIDLNTATPLQLQEVFGIGEALSNRIIKYREKIGGFSGDIQLYNVYGLDDITVKRVLEQFTVKSPKEIIRTSINIATASDISTIPGVSFEEAKRIWEFIKLREGISDFSELKKIEGLTERKLALIQLYLSIE